MPEIPQYGEPQVRSAPLPGVRVAESQPLEAFGGGPSAAAPSRAVAQNMQVLEARAEQKYRTGVEVESMEIASKLAAEETRLKLGLENVKGKDAQAAADKSLVDFDEFYKGINKGIQNDDVRVRAQGHFLKYKQSLNESGQTYAAGQVRQWDDQTTKALVKTEQDAAQADPSPARVELSILRQKAAMDDYGRRNGLPPEAIEQHNQQLESATHRVVLDQMLAKGQDRAAKEWYDAYQNFLVGDDAKHAAEAVNHGSYLGDATRETDRIFAEGGQDLTMDDVRKETGKIDDGKLRKMVEDLARERITDRRQSKHQSAMDTYEKAARLVDANPDKKPETIVPPGDWVALPAEYRDALNKRSVRETDDSKAWLTWMDFARDHMAAASLPRAEFETKYWANLNPTHREQAAKEWQSAGEAASKAGSKLAEYKSLYSDREIILNNLRRAQIGGIDASDTLKTIEEDEDKRKAVVDYTDRVEAAFQKHFADNGKVPDDAKKKQIIADIILPEKEVKLARPWWFDPSRKIKELSDEEIKKVDSGFEEIPASSIDTMVRLANSYGLKLDPENNSADRLRLARAYVAAARHRDALVKSILSGRE